ncbi:MAG TPA: PQQ-binding-like beta-propeller repeat protein [Planctomycetaceae bacterium]|nr:PQQ-binding-like beta-propeller repeat protein [Planctomycetaceae bacterium]
MRAWWLSVAVVAGLLASTGSVRADNWPSWRGPHNNGVCEEKGLATKWSPTSHAAWKTPLPGPAGSTPVIWDGRIYLTTVDADGKLWLMAFNDAGKELWRKQVASGNQVARGDEGNYASPSPSTDGEHVWTLMGEETLACFTTAGEPVWKFNVEDRYGKLRLQFGLASTPVLDGDVLYVQLIHGEGDAKTREAIVVALDKRTGKQLWKVDRPSDGYAENEHSYASPMLYDDGQQKFLLSHGADYIVAHNLKDGSEIWRCGELNRKSNYDPTLRFVASPAAADGIIVVPTAKKGPVLALKPTGMGDITNDAKSHLWTLDKTPDVPSPLIVGDYVYLCMHDGNLQVVERATGKELYFERTHRQRHRASPVYADGHIYLCARDGKVTVVKSGPKFEVVSENELGEDMSSSLAISNGTIYVRTFQHLWAIR